MRVEDVDNSERLPSFGATPTPIELRVHHAKKDSLSSLNNGIKVLDDVSVGMLSFKDTTA